MRRRTSGITTAIATMAPVDSPEELAAVVVDDVAAGAEVVVKLVEPMDERVVELLEVVEVVLSELCQLIWNIGARSSADVIVLIAVDDANLIVLAPGITMYWKSVKREPVFSHIPAR
jgi:hypothetical protein